MHPALSDGAPAFLAILLSMSATVPTEARKPRTPSAPVVVTAPPAAASPISAGKAAQQPSQPKSSRTTLPASGSTASVPPSTAVAGDLRIGPPKVQMVPTR